MAVSRLLIFTSADLSRNFVTNVFTFHMVCYEFYTQIWVRAPPLWLIFDKSWAKYSRELPRWKQHHTKLHSSPQNPMSDIKMKCINAGVQMFLCLYLILYTEFVQNFHPCFLSQKSAKCVCRALLILEQKTQIMKYAAMHSWILGLWDRKVLLAFQTYLKWCYRHHNNTGVTSLHDIKPPFAPFLFSSSTTSRVCYKHPMR